MPSKKTSFTFLELKLIDPIKLALKEAGYVQPTPIQAEATIKCFIRHG